MSPRLLKSWPGASWSSRIAAGMLALALSWLAYHAIMWGIVHAVWRVPHRPDGSADTSLCRALQGKGACWAVVREKYRFILFGPYPRALQWRPALCVALFVALYAASLLRRCWRPALAGAWAFTLTAIYLLMRGGLFGLAPVGEDQWGGLPITLMLASFGLALAFPLAVLLAMARRSTRMPVIRGLAMLYVECVRGVPLICLLFLGVVLVPLFLGHSVDQLLCAQVAIVLFAAAYLSEIVRAGLQAVPLGQIEAADALGLRYWQKHHLVLLPQALRLMIPPLVNTFIGFFKDTSLVLIVGLYDLTNTGRIATLEPAWQGFSTEVYIVLALIYGGFCYTIARAGRRLEQKPA